MNMRLRVRLFLDLCSRLQIRTLCFGDKFRGVQPEGARELGNRCNRWLTLPQLDQRHEISLDASFQGKLLLGETGSTSQAPQRHAEGDFNRWPFVSQHVGNTLGAGGLIVFPIYWECSNRQVNASTDKLSEPCKRTNVMNHDKNVERFWMMFAALGFAFLVSSCGGGGGDGDQGPVASTLDFQIGSATSASGSPSQYTLSGSLDGTTVSMSFSQTPGASSTFEGKPASTRFVTVIVRENGAVAYQGISRHYFLTSPYVFYGSVDQSDGTYTVANHIATFPAIGKVGQSGLLGTSTTYANSRKFSVLSTSTATWSLEADTATTALLCVNTLDSGGTPVAVSDCERIDSAGNILGHVLTITANGKTLTLT